MGQLEETPRSTGVEAARSARHMHDMTYYVEIIELSQKTEDGFLAQRLVEPHPTVEAARSAGQGYIDRRDPKFGQVTFRIVDENGNPAEGDGPEIVTPHP